MTKPQNDNIAYADIIGLERPDKNLLKLYVFYSLMTLFAAPFVFLPMYFKYYTLRYRFDDEGVGVSHGILWRKESFTTYSRIQDIHVSRNIFERWLGIGTVEIQTASGSSSAEATIEGVTNYEEIREFLYARMNKTNARNERQADIDETESGDGQTALLIAMRDDVAAMRRLLEQTSTNRGEKQ